MELNRSKLMKILPLLQQVIIKVSVHRTKTAQEAGLTNMSINAIGIIHENTRCTMRILAKEMLIAPQAATRIVNDLIKKKMVRRKADPSDRRVVLLQVTPRANEISLMVHIEAVEIITHVLSKMKTNDLDALILGLDAFIRAVLDTELEDKLAKAEKNNGE